MFGELMAAQDVNNTSSLPPYSEMIFSAIAALNEKDGSNKTSISKYIESKYGNLPADHATVLARNLSQMKDSGELVFLKNNYSKPDPNFPSKHGRGRPPKPKATSSSNTAVFLTRPRGRPPKDPNASPKPSTSGSGKPRGRPRKLIHTAEGMSVTSTASSVAKTPGSGRRRGRPPKVKVAQSAEMMLTAIAALNEKDGSNKTSVSKYLEYGNLTADHAKPDLNVTPKHGRGRPPKPKVTSLSDTAVTPARPRGRPPKDPNVSPKPSKSTVGSGKPRGRPRKMIHTVEGTKAIVGSGKPRGRPHKMIRTAEGTKATVGNGKPRGRPRKMIHTAERTSLTSATAAVAKMPGSGRRRGRPPKVKVAPPAEVSIFI